MPGEWYVYAQGQQRGPYTWEELWEQARSGALQPQAQVWTEAQGDWMPAREVPGLTQIPTWVQTPPPPPAFGTATPSTSPPSALHTPAVTASGSGNWKAVAAVVGVVVLLAVSCGGGYLLLSSRGGLQAIFDQGGDRPPEPIHPTVTAGRTETRTPTLEAMAPTETETAPTASPGPTETVAAPGIDETTPDGTSTPDDSSDDVVPTTPTSETRDETGLPSPAEVVEEFMLSTLGTLPDARIDYDRARVLMTVAYAGKFDAPEFVPLTYGIQDGPTSYEIAAEEMDNSTATVLALGYWAGEVGRRWRFSLQHEAGLWRISNLEVLDEAETPEQGGATSAFWQLNPVTESFTVYDHGGWRLEVTFDAPTEDIDAEFKIEYRRQDDGSLAYSQESSGVIAAEGTKLNLDSDWTGYDLAQMGFEPGSHWAVAYVDGVEIARGELVVE